jgi:heme-degrading monooxygenase HmoA
MPLELDGETTPRARGLQGIYKDIDVKPTKYVMLTYWTSKKAHEEFHKEPDIAEGFMGLMKYLSIMPYEEYGEIIR